MSALFSKKDAKKKEQKTEPGRIQGVETQKTGVETRKRVRSAESATLLLRSHITEKATRQTESNAYVFVIKKGAAKPQVRSAVESTYGVHVAKINTVNIPRREASGKRGSGARPGLKKAIVTLRKGEKIELT